jgi:serine/threonine protein kinase
MTFDGDLIGTCAFMPPEQICNSRDAKPSSDLYAVGATLYWFLTGTLAHDFSHGGNPIKTILEQDPVPLRERDPTVPKGLADVIHRALSRHPANRFGSAHELREALLPYSTSRTASDPS